MFIKYSAHFTAKLFTWRHEQGLDEKRNIKTNLQFNYFSNSKAKIHIVNIMLDHITDGLLKFDGSASFSTTILFTAKQIFADKNIMQNRIRNENFK